MRPKYIVVHHNGVAGRTIDSIKRTHKLFGWRTIGYHYVIHEDGVVHRGRKEWRRGAHVAGLNHTSIGICVIGNGNEFDFGHRQYTALIVKLKELMTAYGIPVERVLGHRETGDYVPERRRTAKLCPGTKVDLHALRERLV